MVLNLDPLALSLSLALSFSLSLSLSLSLCLSLSLSLVEPPCSLHARGDGFRVALPVRAELLWLMIEILHDIIYQKDVTTLGFMVVQYIV